MATTTRPQPNTSAECWRTGFIPEELGMPLPVGGPRLNCAASLLELMLNATVSPVGPKAMRPLIKLQQYDRTGSLDTFFMKLQHMASYLR